MDDQPYATPAGEHWGRSHASLLDDLSRLLERVATTSARRLLLDATSVVLVAAFQATARSLLAHGARGVGEAIGGDLGLRVQRVLIADSRLARGNASSDNLRIDFERIGVVIWGLDHGVGAGTWTRRQWLDDLNDVRNAPSPTATRRPSASPRSTSTSWRTWRSASRAWCWRSSGPPC